MGGRTKEDNLEGGGGRGSGGRAESSVLMNRRDSLSAAMRFITSCADLKFLIKKKLPPERTKEGFYEPHTFCIICMVKNRRHHTTDLGSC